MSRSLELLFDGFMGEELDSNKGLPACQEVLRWQTVSVTLCGARALVGNCEGGALELLTENVHAKLTLHSRKNNARKSTSAARRSFCAAC